MLIGLFKSEVLFNWSKPSAVNAPACVVAPVPPFAKEITPEYVPINVFAVITLPSKLPLPSLLTIVFGVF